jgi:hypothetical protein
LFKDNSHLAGFLRVCRLLLRFLQLCLIQSELAFLEGFVSEMTKKSPKA